MKTLCAFKLNIEHWTTDSWSKDDRVRIRYYNPKTDNIAYFERAYDYPGIRNNFNKITNRLMQLANIPKRLRKHVITKLHKEIGFTY